MNRIPVSKNFYLDELVDVITYMTEPDHGLSKLDPCMIDCVQLLRALHGKSITINNWWSHWFYSQKQEPALNYEGFYDWVDSQKGIYQSSGFRAEWCKIGAKKSIHKIGGAGDPKGNQNIFYRIVVENANLFYNMGLRRLEDPNITNGWLHMDTSERNHTKGRIRVVGRTSHVKDIYID